MAAAPFPERHGRSVFKSLVRGSPSKSPSKSPAKSAGSDADTRLHKDLRGGDERGFARGRRALQESIRVNELSPTKQWSSTPSGKENSPGKSQTRTPIWAEFTSQKPALPPAESQLYYSQSPITKPVSKPVDSSPSRPLSSHKPSHKRSETPHTRTHAPSVAPAVNEEGLDAAFEAVLIRRNVPDAMKVTMRTLDPAIKADFIRHEEEDKPEELEAKASLWDTLRGRSGSTFERHRSASKSPSKRSHSRGRSKDESPSKRQRSTSRPRSLFSLKNLSSTSLHRSYDGTSDSKEVASPAEDALRRPSDFVNYLLGRTNPQEFEVGKLKKLRVLLRNESVSWVETFILNGGMGALLTLFESIRAIEWREEHEDLLLKEVLCCLKGLCTAKRALDELDRHSSTVFPHMLSMLFDDEKRGPSEFKTRGIVIELLSFYLADDPDRATTILSYLIDPKQKEEDRPQGFLLQMYEETYQKRPYQRWSKEFASVSKEVFWIFLHSQQVVELPNAVAGQTYREKHFPKYRQPEALNPWTGGVEWEAMGYLALHLDLMNGIIASLPDSAQRNKLRAQFRNSGFEKSMGKVRTCKEKFYPAAHHAIRTWVAAAEDDGWDTTVVRKGAPTAPASPSKSPSKSPAKSKAPQLELPLLDIGRENTDWRVIGDD